MNNQPKIPAAMLVAALAAVAATAWAANETFSSPAWIPYSNATGEATPAATQVESIAVTDTLAPSETVIEESEITPAPAAPTAPSDTTAAPVTPRETIAAPRSAPQPPITVEERRLSEDERIQAEVMEKLANNPRLSGKIAVEARDSEVWLSGYTATAGQAWHAARDAGSVKGVRYVHNEIRPRVGHSV